MANRKGNKHTEESKKKIGMSSKGRVHPPRTPEHCKKISDSAKERHRLNPQPKGKNNPRYNQITFNCEFCGEETTDYPSNYNRRSHHFCGRECVSKWRTGENHPNKKSEYIEFDCSWCDELAKQKRVNYNFQGELHFCSKICEGNYASKYRSRENSHGWKGGRGKLYNTLRGLRVYREWRTDVFERDNYTCQVCSETHCELQAHHKITIKEFIENYELKTLDDAEDCEGLWDISNGLTVCLDCHNTIHRRKIK